jgi:hypothetical protein
MWCPREDLWALRSKYLYLFSRWLKIDPRTVDELTVMDFVSLRKAIDEEIRQTEAASRS